MKFVIFHKNGKSKTIDAKDLEEAEKKANKLWKQWVEIIDKKYCR